MHAPRAPAHNLLLRSLSLEDRALLEPHLHARPTERRFYLAKAGEPIEQVHFLDGGVASVVVRDRDGAEMEVGMIGHEGIAPVAVVLGAETTPHDIYIQIEGGDVQSMPASILRDLMRAHQSLREALGRYVMVFLTQATNTAVSNASDPIERRLARWLLMCHDRVAGDDLALTHEFVAMMLGIRRSSVTVSLHVLEGMGAIRSTRGLITVVDRDRLEELAGESYGQPEAEYRKLVGPFPAAA